MRLSIITKIEFIIDFHLCLSTSVQTVTKYLLVYYREKNAMKCTLKDLKDILIFTCNKKNKIKCSSKNNTGTDAKEQLQNQVLISFT